MLLDQLQTICQKECGLRAGLPVLVGVSGGPDSLCLLDALHRLGYPLVAACFNHGLRPEADAEVEFVAAQARERGLLFVTAKEDVSDLARREKLTIEEAARVARYRFLFSQARQAGAQAVAVAHNADDQVETVLMHLLRGSGLAGLRGMAYRARIPDWDERIPLVRPLLATWRADIVAYCAERGLSPVQDASNLNTTYYRNRLRHELLPYLQEYNPRVKEVFWRMSMTLAGDYALVEDLAGRVWENCVVEALPNRVALSLPVFASLPRALQRAVLRRAVGLLRPHLRDFDFEAVERGVDFALSPTRTHQMDLLQNLRLWVEPERLYLSEWNRPLGAGEYPQIPPGAELTLPVPGRVDLGEGWALSAELVPPEHMHAHPDRRADPSQAWLDADSLQFPLRVATRTPGLRFQPLGMEGRSLKLADFWVNVRLPVRARAGFPLVFSGGVLAWAPLFRPAHPFRITHQTRRAVHLWLINTNRIAG